jgi:hypothetical protein
MDGFIKSRLYVFIPEHDMISYKSEMVNVAVEIALTSSEYKERERAGNSYTKTFDIERHILTS